MYSKDLFHRVPIVGILRHVDSDHFSQILAIYQEVGLTTIEITMNTEGSVEMIKKAMASYSGKLNVGAGTVRTEQGLERALKAGAQFIVTPILNAEVIRACVRRNIPVFPGAFTPTEVFTAWELGATAVKIFPAETGGLRHIKALRGPLEQIPLLPTGGVNLDNLTDFFNLGIFGVGMGSQLFPKDILANEQWESLRQHLSNVKNTYEKWRSSIS